MASIHPIVHEMFLFLQRIVDVNRLQYVRGAVLGGEPEMESLLSSLPGQPGLPAEEEMKIRAWIGTVKLEIVLRQQRAGHSFAPGVIEEYVRKLVDVVSNIGDGGPNSDFYPSRLLLSASIRISEAHEENVPTPFQLISREDDGIRRHPWVHGNTPTADWFSRGRSTPVPTLLSPPRRTRITPPLLRADPAPEVKQETTMSSPPSVHSEYLPSSVPTPSSPAPAKILKKRSRTPRRSRSRARTPVIQQSSSDMDVEEEEPTTPHASARVNKKAKVTPPDLADSGRSMTPESRLTIRIPSQPSPTHKKPGVATVPKYNPTPCEGCAATDLLCIPGKAVACQRCQQRKVRCSLTAENWKESGLNHQARARRSARQDSTKPPSKKRSRSVDPALSSAPKSSSRPKNTSAIPSKLISTSKSGPAHSLAPPARSVIPPSLIAGVSTPSLSPPSIPTASSEHAPSSILNKPALSPPSFLASTPVVPPGSSSSSSTSPIQGPSGLANSSSTELWDRVCQLERGRLETNRRLEEMEICIMKLRKEVDELTAARNAHDLMLDTHRVQLLSFAGSTTFMRAADPPSEPMNLDNPGPANPPPANNASHPVSDLASPLPLHIAPPASKSQYPSLSTIPDEGDASCLELGMRALAQANFSPENSTRSPSIHEGDPGMFLSIDGTTNRADWLFQGDTYPAALPPSMLLHDPNGSPVIRRG